MNLINRGVVVIKPKEPFFKLLFHFGDEFAFECARS